MHTEPHRADGNAVTLGARVLVVDDDEANRALLVRILSVEGYRVLTASDGESAIRAVAVGAPDLVLLDVGLPGIDGLEVTRRLRLDPRSPPCRSSCSRGDPPWTIS